MSVSRSTAGNIPSMDELEYTDWKQIRWKDQMRQGFGGPRTSSDAEQNNIEMDQYLGNDEIMELVVLDWEHNAFFRMDGSRASETEPGYAETSTTWEINSGQGEWILSDQVTDPLEDDDGHKTLDWYETIVYPSVQDDVNGTGAGTGPSSDTYRNAKNFREQYGTGPFVDVNDEINIRTELSTFHVSMGIDVKWHAIIQGLVYKVEGARPDLAAPF